MSPSFARRPASISHKATIAVVVTAVAAAWALIPATPATASGSPAGWTQTGAFPDATRMSAISCPSVGDCWAVGQHNTFGQNPVQTALAFHSIDNGVHWAAQAIPPGSDLRSISCPDPTHCWAVGIADSNGQNQSHDQPFVIGTSDGGQTWAAQSIPAAVGTDVFWVSCVDDTHCVAVGRSGESPIGNGGAAVAWYTSDGSTWASASVSTGQSGMQAVDCVDVSHCWATTIVAKEGGGTTGAVDFSADGGATWSQQAAFGVTFNDPPEFLEGISCPSSTHCMAVGGPFGARTTDGIHWAVIPLVSGSGGNVTCPDIQTCRVGGNPTAGTHDFGAHWSIDRMPLDYTYAVNGIACNGVFDCVDVGSRRPEGNGLGPSVGAFLRTLGGGAFPGYWLAASDGGIFTYGAAGFFGSGASGPPGRFIGVAALPDGSGYWLATADGRVEAFGSAPDYGSLAGTKLHSPIVDIVGTPDGHGYWLVGADGGVFTFGNAPFYGSASGHTTAPIVGLAPELANQWPGLGNGYYLVGADGHLYDFNKWGSGNTPFPHRLNRPIVGMDVMPDGNGGWMVASDGGVFTWGAAGFYGSTGAIRLNQPIVGMVAPDSGGYWLVAADGGIFSFGDVNFYGSAGGIRLNRPIVGMS